MFSCVSCITKLGQIIKKSFVQNKLSGSILVHQSLEAQKVSANNCTCQTDLVKLPQGVPTPLLESGIRRMANVPARFMVDYRCL